jgi:hypothetical protein
MFPFVAKLSCENFFTTAQRKTKPQLLTIPYSHYVEFARWSLQSAKIEFDEVGFAPVQHVFPILNARVNGNNGKKFLLADSSTVGGGKSNTATNVPILILPNGDALADSWSIAEYSFKEKIDDNLKELFDKQLGPLVRKYAYSFLLNPAEENSKIWDKIMTNPEFGNAWDFMYNWILKSKINGILVNSFKSNNKEEIEECRVKLVTLFENELLILVNERKHKFLLRDTVSILDIALCALACPLVGHPKYCNAKFSEFNELEEKDAEYKKDLQFWRNTVVCHYLQLTINFTIPHPM